jgi:S-adenosylmethionine:tRNA ribosyltransferase-isomerase
VSAVPSPASTASLPALRGLHRFHLPPELEADSPPEDRGVARDDVRLMVAHRSGGRLLHTRFSRLPELLEEGDLVVVNTSGTLAAEVDASLGGQPLQVHFSTALPAGLWTVELRRNGQPHLTASAGDRVALAGGGRVTLLSAYSRHQGGVRLWVAAVETPIPPVRYLAVHGRPIAYQYVGGGFPLSAYQNVYATEPGSAEMPSAGRPFTARVITRLVARGIGVVPLLLHTGVASLEASEPPYPEFFRVPAATAARVNGCRAEGGRVVAVGTTVVRALESVVDGRGRVHPGSGWTETVVTPDRPVRSVDGLLTGWHEPEASHLAMLEAIGGRPLLERSYQEAVAERYLWHEFGDVHLILP